MLKKIKLEKYLLFYDGHKSIWIINHSPWCSKRTVKLQMILTAAPSFETSFSSSTESCSFTTVFVGFPIKSFLLNYIVCFLNSWLTGFVDNTPWYQVQQHQTASATWVKTSAELWWTCVQIKCIYKDLFLHTYNVVCEQVQIFCLYWQETHRG